MKVSGMKWLWLSTAMVASAACSSATDTQVDVANATAPDRVQSMLGGEGDDFWNNLCDTDETTGNTTCTLNDGNGTECAITYDVDGVVTEQGCEGPWGSYNCSADDETLTCDLAMGGMPACTETFDVENLDLIESTCDFEELFPERPEHGEDHEGPGHGDWDEDEERPDHGDWDDEEESIDYACFEECEEFKMAVLEECRDSENPRECFEENSEEVDACFEGCFDAERPEDGDEWGDEDEWMDEEECDEPGFGPGHDDACFQGCEDLIEATEEECRNAENPRECFDIAGVDIEACFEACYEEGRPDHDDDWGHPGEEEEGDWSYPEYPEDGEGCDCSEEDEWIHPEPGDEDDFPLPEDGEEEWDFPEPDMACVEGCEELARELEEACYLDERPRRCLREARREINACFESCVEMEHSEDEWDLPEHGDEDAFPLPGDEDAEWEELPEVDEGEHPDAPVEECVELDDDKVSCTFSDRFMTCENVFNPETGHVYVDACISHDGEFGHSCTYSEETDNMTCEHIADGEVMCTEEFGTEGLVSSDCEREDFPGEF